MRLSRLKLRHQYHDATIRGVSYHNSEDISLESHLCECGNPTPMSVHLTFLGVRNFSDVQQALGAPRAAPSEVGIIGEIVGIGKHPQRGYVLDLGFDRAAFIDAQGISET